MTPLECSAPTASHDAVRPRWYVHLAPYSRVVLCEGCHTAASWMGIAYRPDRRSEVRPQRPAWSLRLRGAALRMVALR